MSQSLSTDEIYMQRAISLARCGAGLTYPNPMVGAVIVRNNQIIGEGYHIKAGTGHAEVNAINSVTNKSLLKESTIYVSLEPCSHYGKTPPCSKLIIEMGIPRVVVGCIDSFSEVSGRGIRMLREAGISVTVGVLEEECRKLNKRFFTFHEKKRPYIILKWAQSADGFIDSHRKATDPFPWLSNDTCRCLVHKQRATEQVILVGANTIRRDNPSLTTRYWAGANPIRFVVSESGKISADATILTDGLPTHLISGKQTPQSIADTIFQMGLQSVIIEGGYSVLQSFINANLWDEAYIYHGNSILGAGIDAPQIDITHATLTNIDGCQLYHIQRFV